MSIRSNGTLVPLNTVRFRIVDDARSAETTPLMCRYRIPDHVGNDSRRALKRKTPDRSFESSQEGRFLSCPGPFPFRLSPLSGLPMRGPQVLVHGVSEFRPAVREPR